MSGIFVRIDFRSEKTAFAEPQCLINDFAFTGPIPPISESAISNRKEGWMVVRISYSLKPRMIETQPLAGILVRFLGFLGAIILTTKSCVELTLKSQ